MKFCAALLAAFLAAGALGLRTGIATTGPARPVLRLVETSPVTFRGVGFQPRERVRVVFTDTTRAVRKTVATVGGKFLVRFPGADANSCTGFAATAIGNRGSRATFKRAPGVCALP